MDASIITELAKYAADVAVTGDEDVTRIEMGEMADGSRRHFALIDTYGCGLEQQYRVTSPAPWNSPAWAADFREWVTEVRIGDGWMALEVA